MLSFEDKIKHLRLLKWACRAVIMAVTGVSVWANALHSNPGIIPVVINTFPPLIVLGGFELVSRIPVPEGTHWYVRSGRLLAVAGISGIGAWLSYWHQNSAFLRYSQDEDTAMLLPLSIDGLMVIASVSLVMLNQVHEQLTIRAEALANRQPVRVKAEVTRPTEAKALTTREKIALVLREAPDLTYREIAEKVGTGYENARTITRQLRQATMEAPKEVEAA